MNTERKRLRSVFFFSAVPVVSGAGSQ